jgi:uncharacterized protein (TIGR00252 family)
VSTAIGRRAETAASEYLAGCGYIIIDQNWRTRWCEIDIIAQKGGCIYFVEVKYRKSDAWGDGLEYITPKKLQQMICAASLWASKHRWVGDYKLSAIAVTSPRFEIAYFISEL